MAQIIESIRGNRLLWLLAFVPVPLIAKAIAPHADTLLFVLSIVAIVPLAALLSLATENVAERTGDAVGGLLNATLGNLTELIIALAALRAGEYVLVKASLAGAIVTNTLFMMGASFLIGGLRHHVQEFNASSARIQIALLFLASFALLAPSAMAQADSGLALARPQPRHIPRADRHLRLGTGFHARHPPRDLQQAGASRGFPEPVADGAVAWRACRHDRDGGAGQRDIRRIGYGRSRASSASRLPSSALSSWRSLAARPR